MTLEGRTAIITGSTQGIGLAIAERFLAAGAKVTLSGRTQHRLDTALARLDPTGTGRVIAVAGDVTEASVRQELVETTNTAFGPAEILVNNVGGGSELRQIESVTDEDLRRTLDSNLESAFSLSRSLIPGMKESGHGRIINVSSVAGRHKGRLSGPQYSAAKAGMIGMSRHFAWDLAPFGITVNVIAPGFVMTERAHRKWSLRSEEERKAMLDGVPAGRWGTPEEISAAALYLASDEAGYTTGACIDINGGSFMA